MLMIKCDINQQQDLTTILLNLNKFSLTWSCGSRQRDSTSSEWKFKFIDLAVKGLIETQEMCSNLSHGNFVAYVALMAIIFTIIYEISQAKQKKYKKKK